MKFYRILLAAFLLIAPALVAAQPGGAGLPAGVARVTRSKASPSIACKRLKILLIPDRSIAPSR